VEGGGGALINFGLKVAIPYNFNETTLKHKDL
jgi:hypothetical protein